MAVLGRFLASRDDYVVTFLITNQAYHRRDDRSSYFSGLVR
jgi:hypothetical protein